jgi:phage tail sheath protein FI
MSSFSTPGVYLREVEATPPPLVRLSVTGLVGQAERGPLNYPQQINSWGQFNDIFGGFVGYSYLAYSVFGFFLNGGERCYVVRVAHETARAAHASVKSVQSLPLFEVEAINQGRWGNDLTVTVEDQSSGELDLTVLDSALGRDADRARFRSVSGLAGADLVGEEKADTVMIVHAREPVRERLRIKSIDYTTGEVAFERQLPSPYEFPAGSSVLGKGFKLSFRYQPGGRVVREEVFDNLSPAEESERYFARVINGEPFEADYLKRIRKGNSILARVTDLCRSLSCPRPQASGAQNLSDGDDDPAKVTLPYYMGYENGAYFRPPAPAGDPLAQRDLNALLFGMATFEAVNEIGLVSVPDLILPDLYRVFQPTQIPQEGIIFARTADGALSAGQLENFRTGQRAVLEHCEKMGDRFAILDSPRGAQAGRGANKMEEWAVNYHLLSCSKYGALYYPWVREKTTDFGGRDLFIPPGGHVAGLFARVENGEGVGRAPANEILRGVVEFEFCVTDGEQALLNPLGINCLRSFPGRGLRVWGARTLSLSPLWTYVNVRRLCLAIVKQIVLNLQWSVFEPNDKRLWDAIVATLSLFMSDLFQSGALVGATPEEAFFVKCDEETNPPEVRDLGQVVTQVGFAPARPAEFVLVTITRTAESVSVREGR